MPLSIGQKAPDWTLSDQDGAPVSLADLRGKAVVVYFYPKDETPGWIREASGFRDAYQDFTDAGAEVIGVSGDDIQSHAAFAKRLGLPFKLVSDKGGGLRKSWGVPKVLGLLPGRVTYVLDREGVVRMVFTDNRDPMKHIARALAIIRSL